MSSAPAQARTEKAVNDHAISALHSDNSNKRFPFVPCARVRAMVVVSGRLVSAGQSGDLRTTSITRVFGAGAAGNPPARRHATPGVAGNDGKLAPHRALSPLQSHRYPGGAYQARGAKRSGEVPLALLS